MKDLEVVVGRKERGKTVETLSRAPEIVESERCEVLPASAQVEVVCDRTSENGATGAGVRYVKGLQQRQTIEINFRGCLIAPPSLGNRRAIQ